MPAFDGKDLVVTWTTTAGTLTMNTDYRSFNYDESIEFYDQTAGADASKLRLPGVKDGAASFTGLMQVGDLPNWGSLCAPGTFGTIVFCPEGTASGKFAGTIPAYCEGLKHAYAYRSLVEVSVSWLQSGDYSKGVK